MLKQYPFIDIHTHFFNARYLPLQGILMSFGLKPKLASGIAKLAILITRTSNFSKSQDDDDQEEVVKALLDRDPDALMGFTMRRIKKRILKDGGLAGDNPAAAERLINTLGALDELQNHLTPDDKPLISTRVLKSKPSGGQKALKEGFELQAKELEQLLAQSFAEAGHVVEQTSYFEHESEDHGGQEPVEGPRLKSLGLTDNQVDGIFQIFLFIGVMSLSERNKYKVLMRDYAKGKPADGYDPSHFVGLLMDMDEAYFEVHGRQIAGSKIHFKRQMWNMKALSDENDGRLISFGAVDPFRTDWKEYVEAGLASGVRGFKIYPPLGYRPFEMEKGKPTPVSNEAPEAYRERAAEKHNEPYVNRALEQIFPYFAQRGLRMFTHCTPVGFEVKQGYGVFCDPALWRRAMLAHDAQDLWLCLGHGGGHAKIDWGGWLASDANFPKTFAYRAIELVREMPNVYIGLGYLNSIHDTEARQHIGLRLKTLLEEPSDTPYQFRDKVCYGTDWSMPQAIGKTRDYLNAFYRMFQENNLEDFAPAFFKGNAERYLGLTPIA